MSDNVRKVCEHSEKQWPKCECPWHFHFKWKDKHYRFSLDKHLGRAVDSKTMAVEEAATIRKAIKAGTFGQVTPIESMTLRQLADVYLERYVNVERSARCQDFVYALNVICRTVLPRPTGGSAPFGDWSIRDIVTDTVLRFREARRAAGVGVGVNRNLQSLRAMINWALGAGYLTTSPFKRNEVVVVKLAKETRRTRRLQEGEEDKLLAMAGPHLRAVIECALETGMRRGEIMSLQWKQVEGMRLKDKHEIEWAPRSEIFLPAAKTKTKTDRRIPISTRLKAIVEMRRLDPAGAPHELDRYVFGNDLGQQIAAPKRAWMTCVLRSHGHKPTFTKKTKNLSPESRVAFAAIDLHMHDLRREAGSRWLEGGVPLNTVRDWLGHENISQTSTYLGTTLKVSHDAMRRFEERQATLPQPATDSETGGRKRDRSAAPHARRARKTAVSRDPATV